ncbi:MAG TPA: SDR family oxidoreductase [Polyangiaceae bacterium]|nr:SDR family oxidoreductase [Polyangiaceae bacterium]
MTAADVTLVVGASGLLGGHVVQLARQVGQAVRATLRPQSSAQSRAALLGQGVPVVEADLKRPATLLAACAGARSVICTATAATRPSESITTVDAGGLAALIDAAKQSGVEHFVLVSFPPIVLELRSGRLTRTVDFALQEAKRRAEQYLADSEMNFTVLQPTSFMEFWLSPFAGFDVANGQAVTFGEGEKPVNWISVGDVARFAIAAAHEPNFAKRTLLLYGPDPLSPMSVVRIFQELGGGPVEVQHVPESVLEEQFVAATQMEDWSGQARAAIALATARGLPGDPHAAREALPGKLTTVREYLSSIVGEKNARQ